MNLFNSGYLKANSYSCLKQKIKEQWCIIVSDVISVDPILGNL